MARVGDAARNIQDFIRGLIYFGALSILVGLVVGFIVTSASDAYYGTASFFVVFILCMILLFKYAYSR
jgi:hypothetical protein